MKTIKIFGVPSHQTRERTSGVDFARVVQPMKHLDGYTNGKYKFKVDLFNIHEQEEYKLKNLEQYLSKSGGFWKKIAPKYDLVFFNYTAIDWHYAAMATFVHGMGKKLIMDLDDALWYVNPDNIAHDSLKEIGAGEVLTAILKDVDGVTMTNTYLKNMVHAKANVDYDRMTVLSNSIDLKLYNHKSPAKDDNTITLFHYGSTTHFQDLSNDSFVKGIDRIFKDYPNVVLKAIGANIPKLKNKWGERYSYGWGHSDVYKWISDKFPVYMDEADIMVVPLEYNTYNLGKSSIKWMETSSAMKPGVYSSIRPYEEHIENGVTGYLARDADDWYNYLKILIDSKKERERIGKNAYNEIKAKHLIQHRIPSYADFIIKVLNS